MATTEFIAAIEVGSSRITGIVAKKISDGSLDIIAYANEDSSSFIRKGTVYNLDKTATCLTSIINKLEENLNGNQISKVYTAIGGKSMHGVRNSVHKTLEEETVINDEIISNIESENNSIPVVDMDILYVEPQEYKIDNLLQVDPKGVLGSNIEGRFLDIVAHKNLKSNLIYSFKKAKTEIAELETAPIICAEAVLTENEKRAGCVLVNFGADTTTLSIYKNNILRFLTVIPLGGNAITHDLTSLQIEENEAETIKLTYGDACYELLDEKPQTITTEDNKTLNLEDINNLIEARAQEIIENINNQIDLSGYHGNLLSGMIITGGGAKLKNLDTMIRKICKIEKVRISKSIQSAITTEDKMIEDLIRENNIQLTTVLGMLMLGNQNCCIRPEAPHADKPIETSFFAGDENWEPQTPPTKQTEKPSNNSQDHGKKTQPGSKNHRPKTEGIIDKMRRMGQQLFSDSEMTDDSDN